MASSLVKLRFSSHTIIRAVTQKDALGANIVWCCWLFDDIALVQCLGAPAVGLLSIVPSAVLLLALLWFFVGSEVRRYPGLAYGGVMALVEGSFFGAVIECIHFW
ncbi:hypothetical protein L2E82_06373 [Cichorium intybus]|uniref:Uncharacterized protein n=1 Tax=Cichorium intybus TaxID=13427 RepID=A0ACB9HAL8_CICIN|nr:hypothetical protein L2E82_06373 [Cichorium intybus]